MKSVPPLNELFNMAGLELPTYLAKDQAEKPSETKETKTKKEARPTPPKKNDDGVSDAEVVN